MDADQANRIEGKLDALLERAGALAPAPAPATGGRFVGPGITVVDGACMHLAEPIAADFEVSITDRELTRAGRIGGEPSNAPPHNPRRSPAGYPLHYPGVNWAGNGIVTGPPRVIFGGETHDSDEAVATWRAARARSRAAGAIAGGTSFSPGPGFRAGSADG